MTGDVGRAAAAALVADLVWRRDGRFAATTLTPLVADGRVTFALGYDRVELAAELAAASPLVLVLSDSRLVGRAWRPLAVPVTAAVADDPDGERFLDGLLDQELRKHPPSRARLDSPLLRREQWWAVPRHLVTVTPVGPERAIPPRDEPEHGLLAVSAGGELAVTVVAIDDWDAAPVVVRPLAGPPPPDGPALLWASDTSLPDRERSTTLALTGEFRAGRLAVAARHGSLALPPPLGLVARWREEARQRRACRAALRAAGR